MLHFIRRCLIAGLLVWLPIWATLLVVKFLVESLDSTLSLLPVAYQPEQLLGFRIPGLGLVIALLVLFVTGLLVSNFFGKWIVNVWEKLLARIPFVRSIYSAVKQVLETVFKSNGQSFRKVLLVKFPHQETWTVAFLAGPSASQISHAMKEELLTVYVPTTPNPTSGYLIFVKKEDAVELNMSVDEALKYVISLGVVHPSNKKVIEKVESVDHA